MAQILDAQGNPIRFLAAQGGDTLIDARVAANLAALNAETVIDIAQEHTAAIDVRGTFVATMIVEVAFDGTNYFQYPLWNPQIESYVANITTAGQFQVDIPAGAKKVRVRCSAFTSGSAVVVLRASTALDFVYKKPIPANLFISTLTAANTTGTLTIPAAGVGLFHNITRIEITRINGTATAVTGSALLGVTTTNLPSAMAWSAGNAIAAGQSIIDVAADLTHPIKSVSSNTATTIVAPAGGAGVQYRMSVWYYASA